MPMVLVKNFPDRIFAERARQTLEQEGIPSVIQSVDLGIFGAGSSSGLPQGVDLYVEEEDAEDARALLKEVFDGI